MTVTPYNPITTGLADGIPAYASQVLNNLTAIQTTTNSIATDLTAVNSNVTTLKASLISGNYVLAVVNVSITTASANTITIAANACTIWDYANGVSVSAFPAASLTGLSNNTTGILYATYVAATPGWATRTTGTNVPSNYLAVGSYSVDGSGVVTVTIAYANTVSTQANTFQAANRFLSTVQMDQATTFQGGVVINAGITGTNKYPYRYLSGCKCSYTASTTISVTPTYCRNATNNGDIEITGTTTVNLSTNGLNGAPRSANLAGTITIGANGAGTVTVNSGSATVTGSGTAFSSAFAVGDTIVTAGGAARVISAIGSNTSMTVSSNFSSNEAAVTYKIVNKTVTGTSTTFSSDFVVGDIIYSVGNQARVITAIASDTSLTVDSSFTAAETGVTYQRGGSAINAIYYLYAITNGVTPGYILSSRDAASGQTLVNYPTGSSPAYTLYRQLPFALATNSSGSIVPFLHSSGSREIVYTVPVSNVVLGTPGTLSALGTTNVLSAGNASAWATVNASKYVPKIADIATLHGMMTGGDGGGNYQLRTSSALANTINRLSLQGSGQLTTLGLSSQTFQYQGAAGEPDSIYLDVTGYQITADL